MTQKMKKKMDEEESKQHEEKESPEFEAGEEEEEKEAEKSMDLTSDDLEKSLASLQTLTKSDDKASRKDELLEKAKAGKLSDDEREELFKALGSKEETKAEEDKLSKGFDENETLQKAYDVSDYLAEQHKELCKSLDSVGGMMEQSDKRQHEFNLVLAKAVADTGNLVKGIAEKLEVISKQPARAPKSQGAQPMQKSFAGAQASGEQLSRNQVLSGLDILMEKSMNSGGNGVIEGEDIALATAKYEQTHQISRSMLGRVKEVLSAAH